MSIHSTARARSRPQLVTSGVGVERGGRLVLTDISIAVTTGTRLGVVAVVEAVAAHEVVVLGLDGGLVVLLVGP